MKSKSLLSILVLILLSFEVYANAKKTPTTKLTNDLLKNFTAILKTKKDVTDLQSKVFRGAGKSVPALIQVMKSNKYPDKNRWVATMFLGRIMGKKSSPFLVKFLDHPNWVLRMASLKALLALKDKSYGKQFARSLKDKSLLVRMQALENIRILNLKAQAQHVWAMLYDKSNYYNVKKRNKVNDKFKRSSIIKNVIRTVGELKFSKAKDPLFKMIGNKKYDDIFSEIDYALVKITGKKSPKGKIALKQNYWKKIAMRSTNI